jgi:hypothetical protein
VDARLRCLLAPACCISVIVPGALWSPVCVASGAAQGRGRAGQLGGGPCSGWRPGPRYVLVALGKVLPARALSWMSLPSSSEVKGLSYGRLGIQSSPGPATLLCPACATPPPSPPLLGRRYSSLLPAALLDSSPFPYNPRKHTLMLFLTPRARVTFIKH